MIHLVIIIAAFLSACGFSNLDADDDVLTDKLTGTPFEGKTTGDDLGWSELREGDYRTESVDELPIPVFLAFFSSSEEDEIDAGIAIAEDGVGFDIFDVVETWQNDARVIYKVDAIGDAAAGFPEETFAENPAITLASELHFNNTSYSEVVITDWIIELRDDGVDRWYVAHEVGHAMGLPHNLIDYDNDILLSLETDSIMQADVFPNNPQLNDYDFMMQRQGEILQDHLGESAAGLEGNIMTSIME